MMEISSATGALSPRLKHDLSQAASAGTTAPNNTEPMPKITAYIIAFNEAAKIEAAVGSVLWADEVLVADSNSTDNTVALAEALGARVVQVPFYGFGDLRNRTLEHCTHEW